MWVIKDIDKILWDFGTFETREDAQDRIDSLSYFGDLLSPIEINTEYLDDR